MVDASITDACFAMLESTIVEYEKTGVVRQPTGPRLPRIAPSNVYRSKDGKWVVIAANHDTLWKRLAALMGRPELGDDERFNSHHARGENEDLLDELISEWAAKHTAAELDELVNEAGVVCAPVYDAEDVYRDEFFRERGLLVEHEDEVHGEMTVPGVVPEAERDARLDPPGRRAGPWAPTRRRCWASSGSREASSPSSVKRVWCDQRGANVAYRLGVDVGGTFTDLFLVDDEDHRQWRVKTPSTPTDPSEGVLAGVRRICGEAGIEPGALRNVVHGTTVATNAVLESKGARVGLVTTQGFGQILHLARSQTPGPLAGWIIMIKPDPPASLADTREAVERMDARGNTLVPVDREQVEAVVRDLIDSGVESLTVSLINAYVDGRHEREIAEIVESIQPGLPGHRVERRAARVPRVRAHADRLHELLRAAAPCPRTSTACSRSLSGLGVQSEVDILRSDAGVMTPAEAARNPVYGVLSGPSGGVAGALHVATRAGYPNILTFDMGGTSTDVSLCQAGEPTIGRETTIGQFRIKIPSIDVHTVGAGGGSIAHVPELTGALRVGPESAGAEPGPAAYGRGGDGADRDRRQRGRRPPAAAADRRRDGARRRGRPHRGRHDRRRDGAVASRRPPRASSRSSTRTWPARCA